mmetsp:Transcript_31919/g.46633  ORF Transcript_31919/g.46633 Transcript_31919/m.46633 type:complete len:98 (-) Transcript_31919:465-758(-)
MDAAPSVNGKGLCLLLDNRISGSLEKFTMRFVLIGKGARLIYLPRSLPSLGINRPVRWTENRIGCIFDVCSSFAASISAYSVTLRAVLCVWWVESSE